MANINQIASQIKSISATEQITKAMKMVSAARFDKIHNLVIHLSKYSEVYYDILKRCSSNVEELDVAKEYVSERDEIRNVLYVVLSSDKGLCGFYNQSILKKTLADIDQFAKKHPEVNISLLTVGDKAFAFFKKKQYPIVGDFVNAFINFSYETSLKIAHYLNKVFLEFKYDKIFVCYNHFNNAVSYNSTINQYMPIIVPNSSTKTLGTDICIYEPNKKEIFNKIILGHLEVSLYHYLLSANAAEYSARMTAMHKATDNAQEIIKNLKVEYNRKRQANITQEITEIISGVAALSA